MTDTETPVSAPTLQSPQERRKPGPKPGAKLAKKIEPAPPQAALQAHLISGASLTPDLSAGSAISATSRLYWIGVTAECPVECIMLADNAWPKINEDLIPDRQRPDQKVRVPRLGCIAPLNAEMIQAIRNKLPRLVIRFTEDRREEPIPGSEDMSQAPRRGRRGFVITIPTAKEEADRIAAGLHSNAYVQGPRDEPASRYMFAVLCENQKVGNRDEQYPPCLEQSGLDWPGE